VGLTDVEKHAGRLFRNVVELYLSNLNLVDPPDFSPPHFLALLRHLCPARNDRSTAIELHERYMASPIYPVEGVPAGRFGFIFREGECRGCGRTARSGSGRIVDGWVRPPLSGRRVWS
jgi:hypothetical protein